MLNGFILTHDISNFSEKKQDVLQRIESMGTHSSIGHNAQIANTDWYIQAQLPRSYLDPLLPDIDCALLKLRDRVYSTIDPSAYNVKVESYWFQQYGQDDFHGWHIHNAAYSLIAFIELGENAGTRFMVNGAEQVVPVKEGQLLLFPGLVPHCSPPNKTGTRKTSVVLNLAFF
jgi:hypothetical protein